MSSKPLKIIAVTGGRNYTDYDHVKRVLDDEQPSAVLQGECPYGGADRLAKIWCRQTGTPCFGIEANFTKFGRAGGPIRNGWMLDFVSVDKLVAFPGDQGTADAVRQANKRGIPIRDEREAPQP